jgi:hypothetical protein
MGNSLVITKQSLLETYSLIRENVQLMNKYYITTGLLDDNDKQTILNITHGDNFTKIIADIYYHWKRLGYLNQTMLNEISNSIYPELVNYDKNVFPILGFNDIYNLDTNKSNPKQIDMFGDNSYQFDVLDLIGGLREREWAIRKLKQFPPLYLRNLRGDIRKPRHQYQLSKVRETMNSILKWMEFIQDNNPDYAEKTLAKTFSSKNDTFEKVSEYMETLKDYLASDASSTSELMDKLSMAHRSKLIYNNNQLIIIKVGSNIDMQNLGCGSLWCFARAGDREFWNDYASAGYVYLIYDFTRPINDPLRMVVFLPQSYKYYDMYNELTDEVDYSEYFPQRRRKVAESYKHPFSIHPFKKSR